jgi:Protein of unknown function (DUF3667)
MKPRQTLPPVDVHGHSPAADRCRNCDASLVVQPAPKFCPACGQETTLHPPTLFEFLHEFVGHYVALEGALWRTLGLLLLKPGRLTTEYFAGRRRRYVLPLRIYLSASFLFFLVVKVLGAGAPVVLIAQVADPPLAVASAASAASTAPTPVIQADEPELAELRRCEANPDACGWFKTWVAQIAAHARDDPGFGRAVAARTVSMAPYAVFALLPVFAGIVMLAFRRQRMTYGGHFVFSMHMHAFWFIALLLVALLPKALSDLVFLAIPVYGAWALRTVYGERLGRTLWKALAITLMYVMALVAASAAIAAIAIATG